MAAKPENKHILVTGGTGYIGVHTILLLVSAGYCVTVVDNLVNSSADGLDRVRNLSGCKEEQIRFFQVDITNEAALREVFQNSPTFKCCIHFAGLKAVGESVAFPLMYYENNVGGTLTLLKLMDEFGCHSIVFSSSATVYGAADQLPIKESAQTGTGITNAYGRAKYMIEEILKDFKRSKDLKNPSIEDAWSIAILRYFNPVGAHPSGEIGEDPNGIPNNLMPYVAQVVVGRRDKLTIFGSDYNTKDGTGVRDYIHVMDLGEGHLAALRYMENETSKGHGRLNIFNLGTGRGYSVLEMVEAMKRASGRPLPYEFGPRREGDIAESYADASLAHQELGWVATRGLDEMCKDLWAWQSKNPNGYRLTK